MPAIPSSKAPEPEKVQVLFDKLAGRYDRFNRCASLGLDKTWRRALVRSIQADNITDKNILDLGSGTGDLIFDLLYSERAAKPPRCIAMDFSYPMLTLAHRKFSTLQKNAQDKIALLQGNAEKIPAASGSFNIVMSAFVLRNVKKIMRQVLDEVNRILIPGGKIFFLEMYAPEFQPLKSMHRFYLKFILPAVGKIVFGSDWSGDYLAETIIDFGTPSEFSRILEQSGFKDVKWRSLDGGIAAIHTAIKRD